MERRIITATELARKLSDVLARVRYRRSSFIGDRNSDTVARIAPVPEHSITSLGEAMQAWTEAALSDESFADDLERVAANDSLPELPRTP